MQIRDVFQKTIQLSAERWKHIVQQHPEMKPHIEQVRTALSDPDYVKRSSSDDDVLLYYRFVSEIFGGKYVLVAVKRNERDFVVTAYITDKIKKGEEIWRRRS